MYLRKRPCLAIVRCESLKMIYCRRMLPVNRMAYIFTLNVLDFLPKISVKNSSLKAANDPKEKPLPFLLQSNPRRNH